MSKTTITKQELNDLKKWSRGYVQALLSHDKVYEGYDEFYSYGTYWDVNIHACGEPNTIHVLAYAQIMSEDGFMETDTSCYIEVQRYNFAGQPLTMNEHKSSNVDMVLVDVPRLYAWSDRQQYPTTMTLFLDIIGWSDEYFGGKSKEPMPELGYLEADLLGLALVEYSNNTEKVYEYLSSTLLHNQLTIPFGGSNS